MKVEEEEVESRRMEGVDILFLAYNSMVESMYYQGNFSDKDIF